MSQLHICPKDHGFPSQIMEPINTHESLGEQLPLYHSIGSAVLRAYKCPKCGYVEFHEEKSEGEHYLMGQVGNKVKEE